MNVRRGLVVLSCVVAAAACRRGPDPAEAERVVRAYLARLAEAYRASDEAIVDPLVGEAQARKLVGLIGVKRDAGVTLDAQLLDLRVERAEERDGTIRVLTRERWHYADRRIGTGEQVGADSSDSYHLEYTLARKDGAWIVEQIAFVEPPQVGRTQAPLPTDTRVLHGLPPKEPAGGDGAAAGAGGAPRRGGAKR